jgi:iron(III) transport system substrate-binding protein
MSRRQWRSVFALVMAASLSVLAAGCTSSTTAASDQIVSGSGITDALIKAAQKEGTLTLYHATGLDTTRQWVQGFTKKYGIKVVQKNAPAGSLSAEFEQEAGVHRNIADLLLLTDQVSMANLQQKNLLTKYVPADDGDYDASVKSSGYYYPMYSTLDGIAYNTKTLTGDNLNLLLSEGLGALADPRFKGKIAWVGPTGSPSVDAWSYMIAEGPLKDQYGWSFLQKLAANNPKMYTATPPMLSALEAGEYEIAYAISDSQTVPAFTKGAPIRWVYPSTALENTNGLGIAAGAPHPNAARLFMEWATTPEASASYSQITGAPAANPKAKDERAIAQQSWYKAPANTWIDWGTDKTFLANEKSFTDQWNSLFKVG